MGDSTDSDRKKGAGLILLDKYILDKYVGYWNDQNNSIYPFYNCFCNDDIINFNNNCKTQCNGGFIYPPEDENFDQEKYEIYIEPNQKRIWGASRVDQSQYLDSISSLNVYEPPVLKNKNGISLGVNWNQMSDRAIPHIVKRNVPSRGNSTKYSLTRHRPGAASAPGYGVDVKHGSYHRYLERLKGKGPSRTQINFSEDPDYGNKRRYYGISNTNKCLC